MATISETISCRNLRGVEVWEGVRSFVITRIHWSQQITYVTCFIWLLVGLGNTKYSAGYGSLWIIRLAMGNILRNKFVILFIRELQTS